MTRNEAEFLRDTADDLRLLRTMGGPEASDHQLKILSNVLRKLLVYDHIPRAWRLLQMIPKRPSIPAPRLAVGDDFPFTFAVAGGAKLPGLQLGPVLVSRRILTPEDNRSSTSVTDDRDFPFSEYLSSCSIFSGGLKISRQQVVQYVAHKKGGVHWDTSRKDDEARYAELDKLEEYAFGASETSKGKHPSFFELLAIAQQVANAPDMHRMLAAIEIAAP